MLGELLLTFGVILIVYACYKLSTNNADYFKERNLKYKGALFALHNLYATFFGKISVFGMVENLYNAFPDEP